jgi:hypothetical protein
MYENNIPKKIIKLEEMHEKILLKNKSKYLSQSTLGFRFFIVKTKNYNSNHLDKFKDGFVI